jgi:hypothetical protein
MALINQLCVVEFKVVRYSICENKVKDKSEEKDWERRAHDWKDEKKEIKTPFGRKEKKREHQGRKKESRRNEETITI